MFRKEDVRFPAEGRITASNLWPSLPRQASWCCCMISVIGERP